MKKKYVIFGFYYMISEFGGEEGFYGKQMFLGVHKEKRWFIYEDNFTSNTLVFDKKKDADRYIKEHKLNDKEKCSTETHISMPIYFE